MWNWLIDMLREIIGEEIGERGQWCVFSDGWVWDDFSLKKRVSVYVALGYVEIYASIPGPDCRISLSDPLLVEKIRSSLKERIG